MKASLETYFDRLWPICRSITGNGLRESLRILQELLPLEIHEVPTGTQVFDWQVPEEWAIREAWIETPDGQRICDFKSNNLHVLNYSTAVDDLVDYDTLKSHVRTLPDLPDAIPYVTSYYARKWGFCMSHNEWQSLPREGLYHVKIDASLEPGSMSYGEAFLPGTSEEEVLFSTYLCHPSMANNELSGPLALAHLYQEISKIPQRKFGYRFVVVPETIGAIAFLSARGAHLKEKLAAGYVLTCCGDSGPLTYKRSKRKTTLADRVAEHVLKHQREDYSVVNFAVGGSDERQYCSPGFNLPVGSLMRTSYQAYPEYHTSLDNKDFIDFNALERTVARYTDIARLLELNEKYENAVQFCEPQLGKRGLYPDSVNPDDARDELHKLLHFLSYADGKTDLIEIADERGISALDLGHIIDKCRRVGLI
jgi:aminopeptidase-like protein